jgi:hypothetical protein
MANEQNLIPPPQKGEVRNPNGRPKGSKNRSTIARKWLETIQSAKNPITGEDEKLSQEDLMTLALLKKARNGDVAAYKQLMDSGYGIAHPANRTHGRTTDIHGYKFRHGID